MRDCKKMWWVSTRTSKTLSSKFAPEAGGVRRVSNCLLSLFSWFACAGEIRTGLADIREAEPGQPERSVQWGPISSHGLLHLPRDGHGKSLNTQWCFFQASASLLQLPSTPYMWWETSLMARERLAASEYLVIIQIPLLALLTELVLQA